MRSGSCVLALVGAAAAATSTPAGWSPSSNSTLGESFEGIVVTPGVTLSADSEAFHLFLEDEDFWLGA